MRAVELSSGLALLYVITTAVGVVMVLRGMQEGKVRLRGVTRCPSCGRIRNRTARCPCLDGKT
jgi:hypothetical protein